MRSRRRARRAAASLRTVWTPTLRSSTGTSRAPPQPTRRGSSARAVSSRHADPAEQAGGLEKEHESDDREDDRQGHVLEQHFAEDIRGPDQKTSRYRAGEGAKTADHHDDQRVQEPGVGVHAGLYP